MKILMAASENDALPGAKVGGIGDVVRDIPQALAEAGQHVDVVIPAYGALHQLPGAEFIGKLQVVFSNKHKDPLETVEVYKVVVENSHNNVTQWVLHHPLFAAGGVGQVYCNDPGDRPFATDASKFALFSTAVAKAIIDNVFGHIDILHLHDWHTATVSVLRAFDAQYGALKSIRTVYTIHNLALQGVRPFEDDESSMSHWFPYLSYDSSQICDPNYQHCFNPMRSGINLSDKVHAVSVNYAREILQPSNQALGFRGGEGLENDLIRAADEQRLEGILNGCEYNEQPITPLSASDLLALCENALLQWIAKEPLVQSAHQIALTRLVRITAEPSLLLTSVGRLTEQKVSLLQYQCANGETGLDQLLNALGSQGMLIVLGSGDEKIEQFMTQTAARHSNFVFLKGYSDDLSKNLYASGDLFLMPSSFEPCGISQMLAMRAGQPCLAHGVGGLSDTIKHNKNGFIFNGDNPQQQVENMLDCLNSALKLRQKKPKQWLKVVDSATQSRFLWRDAAQGYVEKLYGG